jgi:PAS domain S-box-containing protein
MLGYGLHASARTLRVPRLPSVHPATGHALAFAITIAVCLLQRALMPVVMLVPFILFFLAVFLSAWIGGRGPGFTSTVVSIVLANYYFVPDEYGFPAPYSLIISGLFVLVSTIMTLLCGSLRDAMQEAERTAALLRAVQDQMPAGLIVADTSGELIASNDEMASILRQPGLTTTSVSKSSQWQGFHPDGRSYTSDEWPLARSLQHGDTVVGEEIEIMRGDGTRGIISVNSAPVRDSGGRIIGGVVVNLDITDRKRVEKALVEAARQKDEFLAVLSHELRNPLTPIRNSLYILEHGAPEGEQAKRAQEIITRQVAHLARLVDDLLDVTRIVKGKMQLKRERMELVELVRRTADDHRATFGAANIELAVSCPDEKLDMAADATRIAQVIGNLLHNACKFTPSGGRVELEVTRERGDGVIRITDTGIGIEPKLLCHVFEPFMQAERTLDRSRGGLGLGLALVKGLVELHEGSIAVRSEGTGHGSTFIIKLPLAPTCNIVTTAPIIQSKSRSRRILIVEDNVDAAQSLLEALELNDHQVVVAHSGPEGIAKAREFKPEVILCDIGLPGMDGYELARTIRADELLRRAFLVALTGYALPEDRIKTKAAGFDRHIAKPPSLESLERVLSETGSASI